jgi:hypothetical protein
MADFLDEKRKQITDRLRELKPAVDEYNRLEAATSALASVRGSASESAAPRRRGPGRPRGSGSGGKTERTPIATEAKRTKTGRSPRRPRAGRPKGSGTRAAQALSFVQGQPGITIPELAAKMGIQQTYLYRVMPSLEKAGRVKKTGRAWHPED